MYGRLLASWKVVQDLQAGELPASVRKVAISFALGGRYIIQELERMGIGKRREAILVSLENAGLPAHPQAVLRPQR
jgi:hypothetical protein